MFRMPLMSSKEFSNGHLIKFGINSIVSGRQLNDVFFFVALKELYTLSIFFKLKIKISDQL